ncbi:hypothetical protein AC1031_005070 [Aphanomyces cochlioides]|nr:hypothetical protein AC1031_005070 [Aphanomyces cochlioides]
MCQAVRTLVVPPMTVVTQTSLYEPATPLGQLYLTPLMLAAIRGDIQLVNDLLQEPEIDVNEADEQGNTAIFLACGARREAVVLRLLEDPSLDLDHTNNELATVFHVACLHGLLEAVQRLAAHPQIFINQGNCVRSCSLSRPSYDALHLGRQHRLYHCCGAQSLDSRHVLARAQFLGQQPRRRQWSDSVHGRCSTRSHRRCESHDGSPERRCTNKGSQESHRARHG